MNHIQLTSDAVVLLDQRKLPGEEVYQTYADVEGLAKAIETMVVRGAPAIGVVAAMGIAQEVRRRKPETQEELESIIAEAGELLMRTRPTAVNLFWAVARMRTKAKSLGAADGGANERIEALCQEAYAIQKEDIEANRQIGALGAKMLPHHATVLTHCNAGSLATAGFGTALGVIRSAWQIGRLKEVYSTETRPLMQGARLTAWELQKEGIPVTSIVDSAVGFYFSRRQIQAIVVGADRIAANGDVANKIGTLAIAVLAKTFDIPFYVAAPLSTIDLKTESGVAIPIEERNGEELSMGFMQARFPRSVSLRNPAFDVTPAAYISAIITERGVVHKPAARGMSLLFQKC